VKVGLWGPSQSGKTTYLAALSLAADRLPDEAGSLRIQTVEDSPPEDSPPEDSPPKDSPPKDSASRALVNSREFLLIDNPLQKGTLPEGSFEVTAYKWMISGSVNEAIAGPRDRTVIQSRPVEFIFEVLDVPGSIFDPRLDPDTKSLKQMEEYFDSCDGLVYLYDPLGDADDISRIAGYQWNRLAKGRSGFLKHHLAVCITKFDDSRVFGPAYKEGWLTQETPSSPLLPTDAEAYFNAKAVDLASKPLRKYFDPSKTRYYATSAVGFSPSMNGQLNHHKIDLDKSPNIRVGKKGFELIGPVYPINVLEPLLHLEQSIQAERSAQ